MCQETQPAKTRRVPVSAGGLTTFGREKLPPPFRAFDDDWPDAITIATTPGYGPLTAAFRGDVAGYNAHLDRLAERAARRVPLDKDGPPDTARTDRQRGGPVKGYKKRPAPPWYKTIGVGQCRLPDGRRLRDLAVRRCARCRAVLLAESEESLRTPPPWRRRRERRRGGPGFAEPRRWRDPNRKTIGRWTYLDHLPPPVAEELDGACYCQTCIDLPPVEAGRRLA